MMRPVAECNASVGAPLLSRLQAALKLGQSTRLLQIETALPSASLVVERCRITEAVHAAEPLWAEVDCVSTDAGLPELKALMGEPRGPAPAAGRRQLARLAWLGGRRPRTWAADGGLGALPPDGARPGSHWLARCGATRASSRT
jgi:hypothetical protein